MKNSNIEWIGEIPDNWNVLQAKHCFTNNKYIPGARSCEYDRLALTMNGVVRRSKTDSGGLQPKDFDTYQLLKKDELVFKLIDLQNVSTSRIGLAHSTGLVSPAYIVLRPRENIIPQYAEYFYLMMWHREIFNALGDNGVRSNIGSVELLDIPIIVPPLEIQKSIANFLDKKCSEIDGLMSDIQSQIDVLEEYKKSVITEAVTKGLNPDVEMKDSGIEWIGMIPANWTLSRLKYNLSTPMKYGASEAGIDYSEDLPRYIRITDITSDGKLKEDGKLSLTLAQASNYLLTDDTVLFARSGGTVGKTFLYTKECGLSAFAGYLIAGVTNKTKMLPKWLWYFSLSHSYWEWANQIFTQATIQNIGADKYSNLPITMPNIDEQKEIIVYLDTKCAEIEAIIADKKTQLETLAEYKKSLIYEYVTGKKEVPNAKISF